MMARYAPICGLLVLILAAAVWAPGCGVKSRPIPPEIARPDPVKDLEAASARAGIRLSWSRPEKYSHGTKIHQLTEFIVLRAEGEGPFRAIKEIPITDTERFQVERRFTYIDTDTEIGHYYHYRIVSESPDGYQSLPSGEAALVREQVKPKPAANKPAQPTPPPPS